MASTAGTPPARPIKKKAKALRLFILAACLLALAAGLAPVGLNLIFSRDSLARFLEDSLSRAMARKVTISGDAHFSMFPWLGLKFGPMTVEDKAFGDEPMLIIDEGAIRMRLLPLLFKEAAPADITIKGATLRLKRAADGRANWEGLPFLADENAFTPDSAKGWRVIPRPRGMRIAGGAVILEDELTGRSATLTNLALNTGYGENFNFSLSFDLAGSKSGVRAETHAKGLASFDPVDKRLEVRDAIIEVLARLPASMTGGTATGEPANDAPGGPPAAIALRAGAEFDSDKGSLKFFDIEAQGLDGRVSGEAEATDLFTSPRLFGSVRFRAKAGGRWLAALGVVEDMEGVPRLEAAVDPTSARIQAPPGEYPDEISIESSFTANADAITLKGASLRHGQARLTGDAVYAAGKAGAPPRLTFALRAKSLDLDQLAPPESAGVWKPGRLIPKNLSMRGTLDASDLLLDKSGELRFQDAHVTASAENGQLRLYPVAVLIPGGLVSADVQAKAEGDAVIFDARAEATALPDAARPTDKAGGQEGKSKDETSNAPEQEQNAHLSLRIQGTAGTRGVFGKLTAQGFAPAYLRGILRRQSEPLVKGQGRTISGKADFAIAPGTHRLWESVSMTDCAFKVGNADLSGDITLQNGEKAVTVVDLKTDALSAADLLAFEPDPEETAAAEKAVNAPLPGLPNVEGKLFVKNLDMFGVPVTGFSMTGRLRQGLLDVEKLDGSAYGGALTGHAKAGFLDKNRTLTVSARIAEAKASLLTQALAGAPLAIAETDIRFELGGKGETSAALAESLHGRLTFDAAKGGKALPKDGKKGPAGGMAFHAATLEIGFSGKAAPTGGNKKNPSLYQTKAVLNFSAPGNVHKGQATVEAALGFGPDGGLESVSGAKLQASAALSSSGAFERPPEEVRQDASLTAALAVDPAKGTWNAKGMNIILGPAVASGELSGAWKGDAPGFTGAARFQDFDPRRLLAFLGVAAPTGLNKDLLQSAGLSFKLAGNNGKLSLKDINLRLDKTTAQGEASFPGYAPTNGRFSFSLDRLDMDAYFPRAESTLPSPDEPPYDLSFLRSLDLDVDISIGTLLKNNIVWGDAGLSLSAQNGDFTYRQKAGKFYGGLFSGQLVGDARDITLKMLLELKIEGFDCARFLKDWVEGEVLQSGETTFVLAFRSNGVNETELRKNLAGSFRFQVARGSLLLKESSSDSEAAPADPIPHAAVRPDLQPPAAKADQLEFDVFSASFTVREGVAYTEDFLIKGADLNIEGKGAVDLRDESVDLTLFARTGEGTNIPVTIIGKLEDPAVNIDRSKIVGDMIYRALRGIFSLPRRALRGTAAPLRDMKDILHF